MIDISPNVGKYLAKTLKSYDPTSKLGRGTFGFVFPGVGKDKEGKDEAVAVKVQRIMTRKDFEREQKVISQLSARPHSNVVQTLSMYYDASGEMAATVMEVGVCSLLQLQNQLSRGLRV